MPQVSSDEGSRSRPELPKLNIEDAASAQAATERREDTSVRYPNHSGPRRSCGSGEEKERAGEGGARKDEVLSLQLYRGSVGQICYVQTRSFPKGNSEAN